MLVVGQLQNSTIKLIGFAYGLSGSVFTKDPMSDVIIIKCESVEFEKQFYNISEK